MIDVLWVILSGILSFALLVVVAAIFGKYDGDWSE